MNRRLLEALDAAGRIRAARLRVCTKCNSPVLRGLDNDPAGLMVDADPTPLTPLGELVALLTGRATYDLAPSEQRKILQYRYQEMIQSPRRCLVLPDHRCGKPLTEHTETPPAPKPSVPDDGSFPF